MFTQNSDLYKSVKKFLLKTTIMESNSFCLKNSCR